ncbi:MAG TPA: hypothetical protein VN968_27290, partial [Bradyrhizobium sp.]|nr:hypothetical protein [Bradyrhizobium sp.]
FTLMRIVSLDIAGDEITHSDISEDGKQITHRDETSEYFYNAHDLNTARKAPPVGSGAATG